MLCLSLTRDESRGDVCLFERGVAETTAGYSRTWPR